MSDLSVWLAFTAVICVAAAVTRFNPAVIYSRGILIRLAVLAVIGVGAALALGFFGEPNITRSGVFNVEGG